MAASAGGVAVSVGSLGLGSGRSVVPRSCGLPTPGRPRRRPLPTVAAHDPVRQLNPSVQLGPHSSHVALVTPHLRRDSSLADVRPCLVGDLDGPPLVVAAQPLAVRPVGAEGEPERVVLPALVHVGLDLALTSLLVGPYPVETVRKHVRLLAAEDHHRWEPCPFPQRLHVLGHDVFADLRPDLRLGVGPQLHECQRLSGRRLPGPFRWQSRCLRTLRIAWLHSGYKPSDGWPSLGRVLAVPTFFLVRLCFCPRTAADEHGRPRTVGRIGSGPRVFRTCGFLLARPRCELVVATILTSQPDAAWRAPFLRLVFGVLSALVRIKAARRDWRAVGACTLLTVGSQARRRCHSLISVTCSIRVRSDDRRQNQNGPALCRWAGPSHRAQRCSMATRAPLATAVAAARVCDACKPFCTCGLGENGGHDGGRAGVRVHRSVQSASSAMTPAGRVS